MDNEHTIQMLEAIVNAIEDDNKAPPHGGFITALYERDYAQAAFRADAENSHNLAELIKFREWCSSYGLEWARDDIASRKIAAVMLAGRDIRMPPMTAIHKA